MLQSKVAYILTCPIFDIDDLVDTTFLIQY